MPRQIKRIVIHCSAINEVPGRKLDTAEAIRKFHTDPVHPDGKTVDGVYGRGWRDIGYHRVIERDGSVKQGRDFDTMGAHVAGHNEDTIGICLIGEATGLFTPVQIEALKVEVEHIQGSYGIPDSHVIGHRDLDSRKSCPGFHVQTWMRSKRPIRFGAP